jgi:CRISPR-associated protein Csd1
MILQALYRYYEILSKDPNIDIAPPGYSAVGISFALNISERGELLDIFPLFIPSEDGKQEKPRRMIVPEQVKRSVNVAPNFLWDNSAFVLGISERDASSPEYSAKRFEAFRQFNKDLLEKADCEAARSVIAFLDTTDPHISREHPVIERNLETLLKGGNLIFRFRDKDVHEDAAIRHVWESYMAGKDAVMAQCLVTGELSPIARLHPSLQGVRGANPTGASIVSFNERAFESYNRMKGQGLNSPVSERATFAYATALKYLLSSANPNKKFYLGDATVVYWAESDKKEYANAFASLFEPEYVADQPVEEQGERKKAEGRMKNAADKVKRSQALDVSKLTEELDGKTRFYVLGLSPNAARVSVRFFLTDPFEKIVDRIMLHYHDLEIVKEYNNQPTYITVRHILSETVSTKSKDKDASPLMGGAVFRSILTGTPYPAALYYAIINRIRADIDDEGVQKISYIRAAVIKAFLIRKYHNQPQNPIQEVLKMSLNPQSAIPAYVLGRLFAVLEDVQKEAIGDVNASIKDRYFTSACASPASVFPVLLRLSQHHIAKAEHGPSSEWRIQEILNLLDVEKNPIPARLTLDEQGIFVLGYYHQRADFYKPKNDNKETKEQKNISQPS